MLEYRAYVHHYERYGTTAEDLGGAGVAARADRRLRRPRSRAGAARRGDGVVNAAAAAAALVFFVIVLRFRQFWSVGAEGYKQVDPRGAGSPRRVHRAWS